MKRLLLSAATMACVQASFAQTTSNNDTTRNSQNKELEEVEVTSSVNHKLLYQPAAITKLAPRELQRSTGLFLDDAVNANVPGVQMQRRGVSSGQQFNIRGYGNGVRGANGASSNFDIQGIKVYLNGIPITDAEGITVLDDIDFGSISSAEFIKGPAGTLFGQAIAGAVNLRTMKAEPGKTSIGQQVLLGNYGLERYTTTFQHGSEHSSILVNYGHQESHGSSNHNQSRKDFVNFTGDFTPNVKQAITSYFGFANSFDQRFGELDTTQWANDDYSGNPAYLKNDAHSRVVSLRAGIGHTYTFSERFSNTTTLFGYGAMTDASSAANWTDRNPVNFGARSTFNNRFVMGRKVLSGITGFETLHQRAQTIAYAMTTNPFDPAGYNRISGTNSNLLTRSAAHSLFTEWTLALPRELSVTAGISWNQVRVNLTNRLVGALPLTANVNTPAVFSKDYSGMYSPHLAVNKVFNGKISAYASWSRAFKSPVSSYFYIPYVNGAPYTGQVNPNLVPERADQFEAGSKGSFFNGRISYELAVFHTRFENKMTAVAVPLDTVSTNRTTAFSYVANGGRQLHTGAELAVRASVLQASRGFFRQVTPFANMTYIDGKYENFKVMRIVANKAVVADYSGKKVAGLPPLVLNTGVDVLTGPGFYLNAYYSYRDAVYLTGDNLVQKAKAFGLLNAKLGFRHSLGAHFDIDAYVGGVNLNDTKYYQMVFVNQIPDAYVAAPRHTQWFGGINLKYNF